MYLVGLWDALISVGWIWDPLKLPYAGLNPEIRIGRHAIAIDERRCYFQNDLWGQEAHDDNEVSQDIKQVWFAGVHSDVGGSYREPDVGCLRSRWNGCSAKRRRTVC